MDILRHRAEMPGSVITTPGETHRCNHRRHQFQKVSAPHPSNQSASLIPLAAGSRKLSPAPQNHQAPARDKSARGSPKYNWLSPATLTLLGPTSVSPVTTHPASLQAAINFAESTPSPK